MPAFRLATVCLAATFLLAAPTPSQATTILREEVVCPLDGVAFTASVMSSRSSLISDYRLDGRPQGMGTRPWPLLVCPHNGFVFFNSDQWDSAQLEKLRSFIRTPVYREAAQEEETYYRLARIYAFLGERPEQIADAYLSASWQTPHDDVFFFARELMEGRTETDHVAAEAHYLWYVDQALSYYRAAVQEGRLSEEKANDIRLRCLELSRLVGRFEEAKTYLGQLERAHPDRQSHLGRILRYEAQLLRDRDSSHHDVTEAKRAAVGRK